MLNVQDREQVQHYSWNKVATITFNFTDNFKLQGRLEAMENILRLSFPLSKYASSSTAVTL